MRPVSSWASRAVALVIAVAVTFVGVGPVGPASAATVTAGTPTISGSANVGSTLTVDVGTWDPSEIDGTTFSYQWKNSGVAIDGATSSSYTTVTADIGDPITVDVTGLNETDSASATSNAITPVALDFTSTSTPTISGTAQVGNTLTASLTAWNPVVAAENYTYQWSKTVDSTTTEIGGATSSTLLVTSDLVGATLSVAVTGSKTNYNSVTTTSTETSAVINGTFSTGTPTISGSLPVGSLLTANKGTWVPASPTATFAYQWYRDGVAIDSATESTYTSVSVDIGEPVTVCVSATATGYDDSSDVCSSSVTPTALTFTSTTTPTISGTPLATGTTLTANVSAWSPTVDEYTYQWQRVVSGVTTDIPDETASTYTLTADDVGATIKVVVTGSKTDYTSVDKTSAATATIVNGTLSTGTVSVDYDTLELGATLTAVEGSWSPAVDSADFTYQWRRTVGGVTSDIVGATESTYVLDYADLGNTVRVVVTGSVDGYTTASSTSSTVAPPKMDFTVSGAITLSGGNVPGAILTPDLTDIFEPSSDTTYTYQWYSASTPVSTSATYTVQSGDIGKTITVDVTAHHTGVNDETVTSEGVAIVAPTLYTFAPRPTVTGIPQVGRTLTASTGTWSPSVDPEDFTFQWKRTVSGVTSNISGATDSEYLLVGADSGARISVVVTATKPGFEVLSRTSAATSTVSAGTFTVRPTPTIDNTSPAVGDTLTAVTGTWSPELTNEQFTYQWLRDGVAIAGATTRTYAVTATDRGTFLSVRVVTNLAGYTAVTRTSVATAAVQRGTLTTATPVISDTTPEVGNTLTVSTPGWTTGTTFTYQWKRGATLIGTSSTYTVTTADAGSTLTVTVVGSKNGYTTSAGIVSAATTAVPTLSFTGGSTPTVDGEPFVGEELSVDFDAVLPSDVTKTYTYTWTSDADGEVGTGATYTPTADDLGNDISVSVSVSATGYLTEDLGTSTPVTIGEGTIGLLTAPTILGTARLGRILTGTTGTWTNTPDEFDYQWYRDGEAIEGETGLQYTPTEDDLDLPLMFGVVARKAGFTDEAAFSIATADVRLASFNLESTPTITGTTKVGSTLTSVEGTWSPNPDDFVYQWNRGGVPISGADGKTYELQGEDSGQLITVTVTGVRTGYEGNPKTSAATPAITAGTFTSKPKPVISDTTPTVGQTLTVTAGEWTPQTESRVFRWKRNGTEIATGEQYTVVAADLGAALTVTVTGSLTGYTDTNGVTSDATSAVAAGSFTASPVPTVSGTPKVGETLSATAGTWSPTPGALSYQWKRWVDGSSTTVGTNSATYTLTGADAEATMTVTVTATRTAYTTTSRTSVATAEVEALVFTDVVTPSVTGIEMVGETLTASTGTWAPTPTRFDYQWFCTLDGETTEIDGATDATYTLEGSTAGCTISVAVTGVKTGYASVTLTSDETGIIANGTFETTPEPTISGTLRVGEELTVDTGAWEPEPDEFAVQWYCTLEGDPIEIDGATDLTYTLTANELDCEISVVIDAIKLGYDSVEGLVSENTDAVDLGIITPTPTPTISGIAKVGEVLEAFPGVWGDPDVDDVSFDYQWYRISKTGVSTEIEGATDAEYELTADDLGFTVHVVVVGSIDGYESREKTSLSTTGVVRGTFVTAPTPSIGGNLTVGSVLTVDEGDWAPNDPSFTYQWFRGKTAITGATGSTYTTVLADLGARVSVTVTAAQDGYVAASRTSARSLIAQGVFTDQPVPTISTPGAVEVGAILTANPGSWSPGAPGTTLGYQWTRTLSGVTTTISSATASTYTLTGADAGATIKVSVTGTRAGYTTVTKTSLATAVVTKIDFESTGTPTIDYDGLENDDAPKVGLELTVDPGEWDPTQRSDWSPVANIAYQYQWTRTVGLTTSDIAGATHDTYILTVDDLGATIGVKVTASLLGYNAATEVSDPTQAVETGAWNPSPDPTIEGLRRVGATLTAATGTWGPVTPTFTYQWYRSGAGGPVLIPGETESTYQLTGDDFEKSISVRVRATAPGFPVANRTSNATVAIEAGSFTATPAPTLPAVVAVGATISVTTGVWAPVTADGITFAYEWFRNGIKVATTATYTPGPSDVGASIFVKVTGSQDGFTNSSAMSTSKTVVKGTFVSTVAPTITGTPAVGQTLTATDGTWTPSAAGVNYSYQWFRGRTSITGATATTYVVTAADAGKKISVRVTRKALGFNNTTARSTSVTIP